MLTKLSLGGGTRNHHSLDKGMETSWDPTASLDPMKIQWILKSAPLPSVQTWPRALPSVPLLLVCIHEVWVTLALHVPGPPLCWQTSEEMLSFLLCLSSGITGAEAGRAETVSFCVPDATSPLRDVSSHVQVQYLPRHCE